MKALSLASILFLGVFTLFSFSSHSEEKDLPDYSEKIRTAWNFNSNYRRKMNPFGIEIEGVIDNDFFVDDNLSDLANTIESFLKSLGISLTVDFRQSSPGQNYYAFNIQGFDSSMTLTHSYSVLLQDYDKKEVEISSPIFSEISQTEWFFLLIQHLNKINIFTPAPEFTGVHFHINQDPIDPSSAFIFSAILAIIEKEIEALLNITDFRRRKFAQSLDEVVLNFLFSQLYSSQEKIYDSLSSIPYDFFPQRRNYWINWLSWKRHKTVEIRVMNSTSSSENLLWMIDFFLKLEESVRNRSVKLEKILKEKNNPLTLSELAKVINSSLKFDEIRTQIMKTTLNEIATLPRIDFLSSESINGNHHQPCQRRFQF